MAAQPLSLSGIAFRKFPVAKKPPAFDLRAAMDDIVRLIFRASRQAQA
jgi:hypothetical protein